MGLNGFQDKYSARRTIRKMKIMGAVFEQPAKQHRQSSPFTSKLGQNWPIQQCCSSGSSKMAPMILIFSIANGANYSILCENH
jgi:hypothetical protein